MNKALVPVASRVKEELANCLDFWLKNGQDEAFGGVLTCLDRTGAVYSTDKSVWMQGRCAWMFSKLCNVYGENAAWRAFAKNCLDFMEAHCINRQQGNRMYFQVTREGKPLRQRRYSFSEGFYAMANAEYYKLSGKRKYLDRARAAYDLIWHLSQGGEDPAGFGAKINPDTRPLRGLATPMIYLNLTAVMREADPENADVYNQRSDACVHDILRFHRKKDRGMTLETVGPNGEYDPTVSVCRVLNPGHAIECSWFLMEEALWQGCGMLHEEAEGIMMDALTAGWDKEYGGLLYFMDAEGKPPESYEHDMKLWWPHNETLIATLMAWRNTGKQLYLDWFLKVWEYTKSVFPDPEYGEWYGYLRRDGKPTQPAAKGSTFKGPFHLPRMLVMLDQMLTQHED
ncbi:MAG: AGE family epimerase/isomerase [Christensenellales bacterium]|jgi:N-acylglucosamine 2-epimerase